MHSAKSPNGWQYFLPTMVFVEHYLPGVISHLFKRFFKPSKNIYANLVNFTWSPYFGHFQLSETNFFPPILSCDLHSLF
jgi:hypothetical protein